MARTTAPDLPRQLLDGSLDAAPPVSIRSRIKFVDDALQVMWFQAQIHELGKGREPDLTLGPWAAIFRGVRAILRSRRRASPAVPARATSEGKSAHAA